MDTNKNSSSYNNFIYALGLMCLLNIISSYLPKEDVIPSLDVIQSPMASDCQVLSNFII